MNDVRQVAMSLDMLIGAFDQHGRLTMTRVRDGWFVYVEMNTNFTGAQFEIKSDFGVSVLHTALLQLRDRMAAAIGALT